MAPRVFETDWQKFDGFTPTFNHPISRPANCDFCWAPRTPGSTCVRRGWRTISGCAAAGCATTSEKLDDRVSARHAREEIAAMSRAVVC